MKIQKLSTLFLILVFAKIGQSIQINPRIRYGNYSYPKTHFANKIETRENSNWILSLTRWAEGRQIHVNGILIPADCRGFRSVIALIDWQNHSTVFNRPWTRAEESAVADAAILFSKAYQELGLFPQVRRDGLLGVKFDHQTNEHVYGTEDEPHRLFYHVIGRQLANQPSASPIDGVPFVDPGRQFTLAREFDPWHFAHHQYLVATKLRNLIKPMLLQYDFEEFDPSINEQHKLIKEIPSVRWTAKIANATNKYLYRRYDRDANMTTIITESHHQPFILSNANWSRSIVPVSVDAFAKWNERIKISGHVLFEHSEFVIWRDLKETSTRRQFPELLYWVVWFTNPFLITIQDLARSHVPLLQHVKETTTQLLRHYAKDLQFSFVFHDPPDIGRLHMQVIPLLSSAHHQGGWAHLYANAEFTVTLDRVIQNLLQM